jgi:hypothetical protein
VFFVRQAEPVQHQRDGGQRFDLDAALAQGSLDLSQRNAGLTCHKGAEEIGVGLQHGAAVTANLPRRRAAGLAHPPHQLDRGRGAHIKAHCRLASRRAALNSAHDPTAQIQR